LHRLIRNITDVTRYITVILALALLTAACTSSDTTGTEVGDFSEIQSGEVSITPDASGTTATLTVATNIDAVCAVAYGPTEVLGSLSTDQDMGGGAHDDHQAIMTGLNPETTYQYRLQGVGIDGRLYSSDLMTFTTPPAAESGAPGPNVAVDGAVVDYSSQFSDAFAALNAIDGDLGTEWSSRGDGDDSYLDLGQPVEIVGVGFHTREMSDGTAVANTFTVTIDGDTHGPFPAGPGLAMGDVSAVGQVIRFDVDTSTGGNTGAIEVEIYGTGG
jgi:hypothetical protein